MNHILAIGSKAENRNENSYMVNLAPLRSAIDWNDGILEDWENGKMVLTNASRKIPYYQQFVEFLIH